MLADPPWRYEVYSRETGLNKAAENHYSTMTPDQIMALDVPSIAAKDGILFVWATAPLLQQAFRVIEAWGFDYKTNLVWVKDRIGTGHWFRFRHEHLLVATRGESPLPRKGRNGRAFFSRPLRRTAQASRGLRPDRSLLPESAEDRTVRAQRSGRGGTVGALKLRRRRSDVREAPPVSRHLTPRA